MEVKIIAKTRIAKEYIYDYMTAHKVSANSAEKIVSVLNAVRWHLNDGEAWHAYDIYDFDNAYAYAMGKKFTIRKGIVKEVQYM